MTFRKERSAGGKAARLRGPLFWSATAHLLAVFSLLFLGSVPADAPVRAVVDVLLVGSTGKDRAATERPAPRPATGKTQAPEAFPFPSRGVPDASSGQISERKPAAAEPPESPGEAPSPVADVAASPGGPAGEIHSREGSGPDIPFPDSGEWSAPVARGGGDAGILSQGTETGRPGGGWALLRERIQSRIVYPEEAVRRGQQGEVLLRIRIGTGGVPKEIRIARSSGVKLLDDAARRGVARAAPLPSDPGWVEVPVHFLLR